MIRLFISIAISLVFCFCNSPEHHDFKFGAAYNSKRKDVGSPLIKRNMIEKNCCGAWTKYEIDKTPIDNQPYHFSKTIRAISSNRLTEEEDIYRRNVDDTTILQINILSKWNWEKNRISISGNMGKLDKRCLNVNAKTSQSLSDIYPDYKWRNLDSTLIDSVLKDWGLTRFDNY